MEGMFEVSNADIVSNIFVILVCPLGVFEVFAKPVAPESVLHE
jgi:hypothetical protein